MGMNVENLAVPLEFDAVVDSGTAFTYLTGTAYLAFAFEVSVHSIRTWRIRDNSTDSSLVHQYLVKFKLTYLFCVHCNLLCL
jgi:hypothetical protein